MDQLWLQPTYYADFRCIGAACEDTCCSGWGISVDRETFDRYQQVTHPSLGPKLRELVTIQAPGQTNDYARLAMQGATCSLIRGGLCSVQADLGEEYLGRTCATYPRVVNVVEGVRERSLDLSCPEAARIALLSSASADLIWSDENGPVAQRLLSIAQDRKASELPSPFGPHERQIREAVLQILQSRRWTVEKRLLLVGHICDKLDELRGSGQEAQTSSVLEGFRLALEAGCFDNHLEQLKANAASQLAVVLELVVARMKLDYTAPRFRDLYCDFSDGLQLTTESTIPELAAQYIAAFNNYFAPFIRKREYILEHYLVAYAYKTLFPFGRPIFQAYLLMVVYFAIVRTLAIGLAGKYRSAFSEVHLVKAIQVCSRTMEHCSTYPDEVFSILKAKNIAGVSGAALLTQSFR